MAATGQDERRVPHDPTPPILPAAEARAGGSTGLPGDAAQGVQLSCLS